MAYPQLPQRHAAETERDNLVVICANCQKVRNLAGKWQSLESYRPRFRAISFSHGLCEKCAHALYPEVFAEEWEELLGAAKLTSLFIPADPA